MTSSEPVLLVINADDFGISDGVCRAILELFEINAISNTTIMVAAEGALQRLKKWEVSKLNGLAGVHLQLTSGVPISPAKDIPSLVNNNGEFLPKEEITTANPREVEIEWNRQVELGANLLNGLPTHLDSHHGAHRIPKFFDVYLSIAERFQIPVRSAILEELETKRKQRGIPGTSYMIRDWTGEFSSIDFLLKRIFEGKAVISTGEIIEVVTHPGYVDEHLISVSKWNMGREHDRSMLEHIANESVLATNGITLVRYPYFTKAKRDYAVQSS